MSDIGITISKNSRYRLNEVYKDNDDRFYFSLPQPVSVRRSKEDSYFGVEVKNKHRMDKISHTFYNNSKLWWIIALANNLENSLFLDMGETLRVPSISVIYGHGGILSDI